MDGNDEKGLWRIITRIRLILGIFVALITIGTVVTLVLKTVTSGNTFQPSVTYTFNSKVIGHSKPTHDTNGDANVILESLTVNTSAGTLLLVGFDANDTQTNFSFYGLKNIYFVDNDGTHYGALTVNQSQMVLLQHQEGTLQVTFPTLPTSITWLDLHFNTDGDSLNTPCVRLMPNGKTSAC